MRGFSHVGTILQKNSGASALLQCHVSQLRAPFLSLSTISKPRPARNLQYKFALATATVTMGTGLLIGFSEDLKHWYAAAQRSGRVLLTLATCINE